MWSIRLRQSPFASIRRRVSTHSSPCALRSLLWAPTEKHAPSDAAVPSHQLLVRAGFVRKSGHGLYALLPLGHRVMAKLETIIDEEMAKIGGNRVDLTVLTPCDLWKQSGRWQGRGPELMTLEDRREELLVLGPTHEESMTSLVAAHYNAAAAADCSLRLYQIDRKFRDEIRPRFGLLRAREFVMKDMYSFDATYDSAWQSYQDVTAAYNKILISRLKLPVKRVEADSGTIGGNLSHEFHVLADVGEDAILSCSSSLCDYAANVEKAEGVLPPSDESVTKYCSDEVSVELGAIIAQLDKLACAGDAQVWKSVSDLHDAAEANGFSFNLVLERKKNLDPDAAEHIADDAPHRMALCFVRHDRTMNELAAKPYIGGNEGDVIKSKVKIVELLEKRLHTTDLHLLLDDSLKHGSHMSPAVKALCDAIKTLSKHDDHVHLAWGHFRQAQAGDCCPRCKDSAAVLEAKRGIEVGHVFYLGKKYSEPFGATYTDAKNTKHALEMGCYGLGVSRLVAAAVEASHDDYGIVWPTEIAPYKVLIMSIGGKKESDVVSQTAWEIAGELASGKTGAGLTRDDVLLDDRWRESPGSKLVESELIGFPYRVVVGKRFATEGFVEVQMRRTMAKTFVPRNEVSAFFAGLVEAGLVKTKCLLFSESTQRSQIYISTTCQMSVSVERLGNGAAFCLRDELTGTTVLLGCGEAKDLSFFSADEANTEDLDAVKTQYRRELKDLMRREGSSTLAAILVPDYRPVASYMLPYITEKCGMSWMTSNSTVAQDSSQKQSLVIMMTHGTRAIAPHILTEYWTGCHGKVKDKSSSSSALYDVHDVSPAFNKAKAVALKARVRINDHLNVTAFHAGHVAGGCAFYLEIGTTTVLYANDFNFTGGRVLLPAQIPRLEPCALISRSSFAVTVSETQCAMERELVKVILECISSKGKVVIPIYRLGYFHELVTILLDHWQQMKDVAGKSGRCPIYISDAGMAYPSKYLRVLSRTCTPAIQSLLRGKSSHGVDLQVFDWARLQQPGPFVLFTGPANIAQGDSLRAIKAVASDPKNLIVLSEYCTPGTVNYLLYADPERKRVSKRLGVNVECGVHYQPCGDEVDTKSIVQLVSRVAPRQVILDHSTENDLEFVKMHIQNELKMDPAVDTSVVVKGINPTGRTPIEPDRDIPLRIHKAMFNNPSDVQGMLIAETKRKLMLLSSTNGARRLKKKKHSLLFSYSWKKPLQPSPRVKKKSQRPASALSFLLSAAVESADEEEEEESEQQPQASLDLLLQSLEVSLAKWVCDVPIEKIDRWLKLRTVGVAVSAEWEVHMEWSYDDEALAGRVLGIAKQVVYAEYKKQLAK